MVSQAAQRWSHVDPRVTRTRKLIRDALLSLLAEKSFETINVRDIAERGTINRATFYAHYTDKFALLNTLVREDVAARLADGDPLNNRSARSMLLAVGRNVFSYVADHKKCRIDRDFEPEFQRAIETELTNFLSLAFDDCAAMLIASALAGGAMNWRHRAPKSPTEPIITTIVDILVEGVKARRLSNST
jgi:AcrR family transcriptional regulator